MNIYGFEFNFGYDEDNSIENYKGLILAEDYGSALYKITSNFKNSEEKISDVRLEIINPGADNCIYVEDDVVFEKLKDWNRY